MGIAVQHGELWKPQNAFWKKYTACSGSDDNTALIFQL